MNFKQHRVSNNLTQEQVAQDVGVQRTTVAMWESGKSRPRAELLPKLAKLFGCSIEEAARSGRAGKDGIRNAPQGAGAERRCYGMPREKELYVPTLERIRGRADRIYPDKLLYNTERGG